MIFFLTLWLVLLDAWPLLLRKDLIELGVCLEAHPLELLYDDSLLDSGDLDLLVYDSNDESDLRRDRLKLLFQTGEHVLLSTLIESLSQDEEFLDDFLFR